MAIEKKILKNRPFVDAKAQYNFENDVNIGVDQEGRIDVQNDLYTIYDDTIQNQEIINNTTLDNINLYTGLASN